MTSSKVDGDSQNRMSPVGGLVYTGIWPTWCYKALQQVAHIFITSKIDNPCHQSKLSYSTLPIFKGGIVKAKADVTRQIAAKSHAGSRDLVAIMASSFRR